MIVRHWVLYPGILMLVLFLSCIQLQAQSLLDQSVSNFKSDGLSAIDAIIEIGEKADINISFSSDIFENNHPVFIKKRTASIQTLLGLCLKEEFIQYEVKGESIILTARPRRQKSISGFIRDAESGEPLIGAYAIHSTSGRGTTSNEYGFYSLTHAEGYHHITVSYVGYQSITRYIKLDGNKNLNFKLVPNNSLIEVVVEASRYDSIDYEKIPHSSQSNKPSLEQKDISEGASLGGEKDILQLAYLKPGVQSGVGGLGGMHVRGGHEDQNLILMDGVTVYNHAHALGIISIFNSSAINQSQLIKGGFSAKYGGRLSSVLDVRTKEGNINKYQGELHLGTFASRLTFQGPFKRGKAGFFLSVRRTHLDPIIKGISRLAKQNESTNGVTNYTFYDINAKIHWAIGKRDKLYFSFYRGGDNYKDENINSEFQNVNIDGQLLAANVFRTTIQQLKWGNRIQSIRWNRKINNKMFMNMTTVYSNYNYGSLQGAEVELKIFPDNEIDDYANTYSRISNQVQETGIKLDFDYVINTVHALEFGTNINFKNYSPSITYVENTTIAQDSIFQTIGGASTSNNHYSNEIVFYAEDKIHVGKWFLQLGLYASTFESDSNNRYYALEPRVNVTYQYRPKLNFNFTATRMTQNIHLLSNEGVSLPNDLWVPATQNARPQSAWQTSLGMNWDFHSDWAFNTELYYKYLKNVIAFRERIENPQVTDIVVTDWEDEVIQGNGKGMGWESMIKKKSGNTNGWISYTLSKSNRRFPLLNDGNSFPYSYDRRHLIQVVFNQRIYEKLNFSANWVYGTGRPITLIATNTLSFFQNSESEIIGSINSYKLPDYHRLNIGFDFHFPKKWGGQKLSLGLYNAYNEVNVFYQYYQKEVGDESGLVLNSVTFLPIFPTLGYSIYFN